eukprot:GABU01008973.1.p1 GENE.GABU01008973.1~~GABU01008973.1.p1  ORF type:complete len:100 (-),score=10.82 GABU01008973.1:302-556(-)
MNGLKPSELFPKEEARLVKKPSQLLASSGNPSVKPLHSSFKVSNGVSPFEQVDDVRGPSNQATLLQNLNNFYPLKSWQQSHRTA